MKFAEKEIALMVIDSHKINLILRFIPLDLPFRLKYYLMYLKD